MAGTHSTSKESDRRAPRATVDRGLDRREALLRAALECFSERGFYGTNVPQIAERAGVSLPTLYRYFESKEVLVNAVYQHCKMALGRALIDDFPAHGTTAREMFHAFWVRLGQFFETNPAAFRFLELHAHPAYLDAKSRDLSETVHAAGRMLFEETARRGETHAIEPELLLSMVWGTFAGVVKGAQDGRLVLDRRALDAAEDCLWNGIRRSP